MRYFGHHFLSSQSPLVFITLLALIFEDLIKRRTNSLRIFNRGLGSLGLLLGGLLASLPFARGPLGCLISGLQLVVLVSILLVFEAEHWHEVLINGIAEEVLHLLPFLDDAPANSATHMIASPAARRIALDAGAFPSTDAAIVACNLKPLVIKLATNR